jgi:hypothetical protein
MGMRFDEKCKIFTDVISKEAVPAYLQMSGYRIHGLVYVRPGERIKDELNQPEEFMAITDAVLQDADGEVIFRAGFLAVNRSHILWVIPESDLLDEQSGEEGGV